MPLGDAINLLLYRAGVGVDVEGDGRPCSANVAKQRMPGIKPGMMVMLRLHRRVARNYSVSGSKPVACFCGGRGALRAKLSKIAINGLPIVLRNRVGPLR
jgi:hypothetical protein